MIKTFTLNDVKGGSQHAHLRAVGEAVVAAQDVAFTRLVSMALQEKVKSLSNQTGASWFAQIIYLLQQLRGNIPEPHLEVLQKCRAGVFTLLSTALLAVR